MDDEGRIREIRDELQMAYELKLELHPAGELEMVPSEYEVIANVTNAKTGASTWTTGTVGAETRLAAAEEALKRVRLLSSGRRSQASLEAEATMSDSDTSDEPEN